MPGVIIKPGDPLDKMMRIFKKQVEKAGIIGDLKKKMHYEKPSIRLKKKSIAARKRRMKQMRKLGQID
ncbi:MAG: 30S ribosomal protein S21 [Zetaproteobacteria bacterium]|nr:30S ribosomal protein S21 [Zetaproteobacteria bacterium]